MDKKKNDYSPFKGLPSQRMKKNNDISSLFQGFNLVLNFGIVMAVSLWITTKVGGYIDAKLGTGYLFTIIGIGMGIFSSFRVLFDQVKSMEKQDSGEDSHE